MKNINKQDFITINETSCGMFCIGRKDVKEILSSKDKKIELVFFENSDCLAVVKSKLSNPTYYRLQEIETKKPIKYILMDLDGTTINSEKFWIEIIRKTIASLMENTDFEFENEDFKNVSGHSVTEHLLYCINKYCPNKELSEAKRLYQKYTKNELDLLSKNGGSISFFEPNEGLKEFLLKVKSNGIKIALVTSGVFEKVLPSINSVFEKIGLGNPLDFYDCIITAGNTPKRGVLGTIGEIYAKPHPCLYAEAFYVGLGLTNDDLKHTIGIEDSSAGIYSLKLLGVPSVGIAGGNIKESGTMSICDDYVNNLNEIIDRYL